MRKFIALAVIVLAAVTVAAAQEVPQVEIFGGYSLFHFDKMDADTFATGAGAPPGSFAINQNMHGWEGAVQFNINKWLGAVADFSGHYGTPGEITGVGGVTGHTYNYLFGPQINVRGQKAKGFVHVLFGGNNFAFNDNPTLGVIGGSDNAFGMAIGGGVDVNVTKKVAVRVGQFDYIYTKHNLGLDLGHQNNFRFSAGLVLNLGSK